ncbi:MAG: hypothetical protein FJY67_08630 [Calditrichaeota bacterium]|nr:hypothetical protein [Calditrichota bacterium]
MRKLTAFFCIVMMLTAGVSMATQTRQLTLGENNYALMDEENVFMWPQLLAKYQELGTIDISGGAIDRAGVHQQMGNFTLGSYWSTMKWMDPYMPYPAGGLDEKIQLMYARELGGMPFGFTFALFGNGHEMTGTDKTAHSGLGLNLGFGLTLMENLETSLSFSSFSWEAKDASGATVNESEGGTTITIQARYWMMHDDKWTFVPHFSFQTASGGHKPGGTSIKDDWTTLDIGFGDNYWPTKDVMFVDDIGIRMMSGKTDVAGGTEETDMWLLPYFKGGMEAPLSDKFTFRFGGVREWTVNTVKEADGDEETVSGATTRFYIGAAYNRGPFSADFHVDPGFFTRGPYLVTGASGPLAFQVSLKYMWGM